SLPQAIEKLTSRPAAIFHLEGGSLKEGKPADIVIFDPEAEYIIDVEQFRSKSKNSPFHGWNVRGKVMHTLVGGKMVYSAASKQTPGARNRT
ncbi:MAG: amidohydrolase family protein, partial [Nitrospinaceae bacterium]|nr:amidohydrolase family protein [Nitrospinaceae bacterium]NIR56724.1 amidohydrolase family protein [Nitrospinaceae bacterium]NIS87173.1 amidohydrolase family protein [Nitrospinaceae bacterium]NIT84042.1 amidohydrolase family protein [Nitrospinaceae bacterium]NIU46225.1 amidohydrolase family protein [Nitrospinaceae bacterium]